MESELTTLREQLAKLEAARAVLDNAAIDAKCAELAARIAELDSAGGSIVMGDVTLGDGSYAAGRDLIINPDAPPEELLRLYYRGLAAECARLPLGMVDHRFAQPGQEGRVALRQVYVDLDVTAPVRAEAEDARLWGLRLARGEGAGRTPALEALSAPEARCAALLGDAGSGKTTFVNYLTHLLADAAARKTKADGLPSALAGLWPVRLILRDIAARGRADARVRTDARGGVDADGPACDSAALLWDALQRDMALRLSEASAAQIIPYVQKQVRRRGALFLLDGLDEVPQTGERRAQLLAAIRDLTACLPPNARVLLTARPYAYADPAWQLEGFPLLTLAPFDERQAAQFVDHWYAAARPALGLDAETAAERARRLAEVLREKPYLGDMASRPLLLTLMAALHSRGGKLPEDRAALYEESVDLLLARWQRGREVRGPDGRPTWEPGIEKALDLGEARIRAALEQVACNAHMRQREELAGAAETASAPADIPLSDVLAVLTPRVPADMNPLVLLDYLEQRAGLLLGRRPGVYAFPHRSFQEYLTACHLANTERDFAARLSELARSDPAWWREVFLLGVGKKRLGGESEAVNVVDVLNPGEVADATAPAEADWRAAALAGQALLELKFPAAAAGNPYFTAVLTRARRWLAALIEGGRLPTRDRWQAGDVLAQLGDPRPGVTAVPGIVWRPIPAGPFLMGSADDDGDAYDDEKPQHSVTLPDYYLSRYLTTNAQYRPFVETGGYDDPAYWTAAGWAWRQGAEPDLSPLEGLEEKTVEAYRNWLAGRPKERRDRPFWWNDPQWGLPTRPVVGVTWFEAAAYCRWLGEQLKVSGCPLQVWRNGCIETVPMGDSRFAIRLPSEAEWEKGARTSPPALGDAASGSEARRYPWGNEWLEDRANTKEADLEQTSAVGLFPAGAGAYGLLDMAGNVWQWTRSRWGANVLSPDFGYPYVADDGREDEESRAIPILRGGSWLLVQSDARCAYRHWFIPDGFSNSVGFRVALSLGILDSGC